MEPVGVFRQLCSVYINYKYICIFPELLWVECCLRHVDSRSNAEQNLRSAKQNSPVAKQLTQPTQIDRATGRHQVVESQLKGGYIVHFHISKNRPISLGQHGGTHFRSTQLAAWHYLRLPKSPKFSRFLILTWCNRIKLPCLRNRILNI